MGKKTLYHPVSLNVLRGAAEYGGFVFGKFRQIGVDQLRGKATYEVQIVGIPQDESVMDLPHLWKVLKRCFSTDVTVDHVWLTKQGAIKAQLHCVASERLSPVNVDDSRAMQAAGINPDDIPF